MTTDPIADLERAARALDQVPDRKAREWLRRCVGALLAGDDPRPSLGIPRMDNYRLRLARRDYWLRIAYGLMDEGLARGRCESLEKEATRFESIIWPRWRGFSHPPEGASRLRSCLFNARLEGPIPGWRQLYRICVSKSGTDDTTIPAAYHCRIESILDPVQE